MKKSKCRLIKIPKYSNPDGFYDEGISSVLGKPPRFKYSELFLKRWYK